MAFVYPKIESFVRERYRDDPDQLSHVLDVAVMASTADDYAVALLHDMVEDEFATWEEIEIMLGDDAGRLVPALKLLTRGNESYDAYIDAIATSENTIALNVKMLDLFDHLSPYKRATLPRKNTIRYLDAIGRLVRSEQA